MLILATLNKLLPYSVLWGETDTDYLTTRCRAWTTSNFIFCSALYFLPAVDSELFSLPDCSRTDADTREQIISLGVLQLILSASINGCFRESCPSWHKNTSPETTTRSMTIYLTFWDVQLLLPSQQSPDTSPKPDPATKLFTVPAWNN